MHQDPELVDLAYKALLHAYAPYSHYRVGAALRCSDGTVYTGCNVENASYGVTMCAERTAVYKAVSEGRRDFVRIAVVSELPNLPYPCGACLQAMAEWGNDIQILMSCPGKLREGSLYQHLPHRFSLQEPKEPSPAPEGRDTL